MNPQNEDMKTKLIPHECLADYLATNFTARQIADRAGITTQYAYTIRNGTSQPSIDILNALGLQVKYEISPKS